MHVERVVPLWYQGERGIPLGPSRRLGAGPGIFSTSIAVKVDPTTSTILPLSLPPLSYTAGLCMTGSVFVLYRSAYALCLCFFRSSLSLGEQ